MLKPLTAMVCFYGPTVITAPFLFDELFELFDRNIEDYVEATAGFTCTISLMTARI